jgi:hypothetical protein
MAARRLTPAQARERNAKIAALGLSVVFVIVAAIEGPTLLKSLHKPSAAKALPVVASAPTQAPISATSTGQLTSFSRFRLQDPFRAQAAVAGSNGALTTTTTTPVIPPAPKAQPTPRPAPVVVTTPVIPFTSATKPVEPPNAALITLNGERQIVLVGAAFPTVEPLFKLVALGKEDVKIGVLGGSFKSGEPTLALLPGRPITLADEADGSRYVLRLVRLTVTTPAAQAGTAIPR